MPRTAGKTSTKRAYTRKADKQAAPPVKGVVKAMTVSMVGQGTSDNRRLADRVEQAMNEAMETAVQRGITDPKKLLQAKIDARKEVLDSL